MKLQVLEVGQLREAAFVDRPNRFVVRCRQGARTVEAFLPNPGRLWELLLPGARLWLADRAKAKALTAGSDAAKHRFIVVAVERDGRPVLLHTHWTNRVARVLLEQRLIPGLEAFEVVRAEVRRGGSRFDFLLRRDKLQEALLEVKSCTLFGNRVAMFPDAVTERGRRHLQELATLSEKAGGVKPTVLFLVHTPEVDWFMPDFHTDLAFGQTLLEVKERVKIVAVSLDWQPDLSVALPVRRLQVPWTFLQKEMADRGAYLLILELQQTVSQTVGRLGELTFQPGFYIYVGSARRQLSARVARHCRRRKRFHWHIDYLRDVACSCTPLPIRSSRQDECALAEALSQIFSSGPLGFGCSDCSCPTHLFYSRRPPLQQAEFHKLLQHFRMRPPST